MRRLAPQDVAFLLLENRHQAFHVGALNLLRPPAGAPSDFAAHIAERLHQSKRAAKPFDQRLMTKFGVSYWETDPNFDLSHHFIHLALPKPGHYKDLLAMVSRVHSAHLDRAYPLWRTYLIEGLEDGRIATYSKIHHSLVDGVAAIRLMLKSMSPDPEESLRMPPPWEIRPSKASTSVPVPVSATVESLTDLMKHGPSSVMAVWQQLRQTYQDLREKNPDIVSSFQAPHCSLNQPVTGSRQFAAQSYSMPRIKAVAQALDGTANDVILALTSSSLRRYLADFGELPEKPLIAVVPFSIRQDDSEIGNEITFALVNLATHVADPVERFSQIKHSMDYAKQRFQQMSPTQRLAYSVALLAPGAIRTILGIDKKSRAIANVVISNVPGPRQPVYWQGCLLEGIYPASIVLDGFALNITLVSRHDAVDFGLIACRRAVPQMQRLLDYIEEALVELESAVK